jgi:hypothetical protein
MQTEPTPSWGPAALQLVKDMLEEEKSAPQIAEALWVKHRIAKSRNAVISAISRYGLRNGIAAPVARAKTTTPRPAAQRPRLIVKAQGPDSPPATWTSDPKPPKPMKAWEVGPAAVDLVALPKGCCKFPVGAATGSDQLFCGEPRADDHPNYCPGHVRIAEPKRQAA